MTSGKWYFETTDYELRNSAYSIVGLKNITSGDIIFYVADGDKKINGTSSSYGASVAASDVVGVALNLDDEELSFYKNGVSQGVIDISAYHSQGDVWFSRLGKTGTLAPWGNRFNFGQDSTFSGVRPAGGNQDDNGIGDFAYAPPSGYLALCTANLPTPTIVDGSTAFNTVLYDGNNNTGSQSVTGVGFQPDFLWLKERTTLNEHYFVDVVRGDNSGVMRTVFSSSNKVEEDTNNGSSTAYGIISSLDSDGFTVDSGITNSGGTNYVGRTYVAWNWKAGGTAVSNTDGTITSQVSANTDAGFSIVSYTGTSSAGTIGHGLSSAPEMIIVKNRDVDRNWGVYHAYNTSAPETDYLNLNLTAATDDSTLPWNDTAPTSSVFSVGTSVFSNRPSEDFIAYCFHSVEGFSKAGSYTGNGSTDGTFVYTGFRPAWVMVKRAVGGTSNWDIMDSARSPFNIVDTRLYANLNNAEPTATDYVDFTSNGFKIRNTANSQNASGSTYIYLAFAENPFKYANAR